MSVVAEVLGDPVVDGGQSDFRLLAGLHGHADEGGVGVRRLDLGVSFVVHLRRRARLDLRVRAAGIARRRAGVAPGRNGAARIQRHPGGGGVPGGRAGRGVSSGSLETEALHHAEMLLRGRAAGSGTVRPLRVRAEDGEVLEPVKAGEAVIQRGSVSEGVLREHRQPAFPKLAGTVETR